MGLTPSFEGGDLDCVPAGVSVIMWWVQHRGTVSRLERVVVPRTSSSNGMVVWKWGYVHIMWSSDENVL